MSVRCSFFDGRGGGGEEDGGGIAARADHVVGRISAAAAMDVAGPTARAVCLGRTRSLPPSRLLTRLFSALALALSLTSRSIHDRHLSGGRRIRLRRREILSVRAVEGVQLPQLRPKIGM